MASSSDSPRCLQDFVEGGLEEISAVDAGNFDRVLEGEKNAFACAFLRVKFQQVEALVKNLPPRSLRSRGASGEDGGECASCRCHWAP